MELWDDMKREMKDAVDFTAKKAGELTGTAKLKYQLHMEKTHQSELYEGIGKLYYESVMHGGDNVSKISSLMADVSESQNKIADLERRIGEVGGQE